jgi:hypothetical protein
MIPAISSRKFLADEFDRTIATIGITMIVTNTAKIRKTRNSIGLSCRNYMPIFGGSRQKGAGRKKSERIAQPLGLGVGALRVKCHTPTARAIAPSPYASTAISPR